jgi:PAS domain S-box-containing protein
VAILVSLMMLERLSRRIESARTHAVALQQQAGALDAAATAALNQAVEEQAREQQDTLLAAQAAVEAERERYRRLFHLAPNASLVTNAAGIIREANDAAAELLGVTLDQLVDKPLVAFVDPTVLPRFPGDLTGLRDPEGEARALRVRIRSRNGQRLTRLHPPRCNAQRVTWGRLTRLMTGAALTIPAGDQLGLAGTDQGNRSDRAADAGPIGRSTACADDSTLGLKARLVRGFAGRWRCPSLGQRQDGRSR